MKLVPAVIRQYSKVNPRKVSSRRSVSTTSALVVPGGVLAMVASMASITASEAIFSICQFGGGLLQALALHQIERVDPVGVGERGAQHFRGVIGQEAKFGGDAFRFQARLLHDVDRLLHGIGRGVGDGLRLRRPQRLGLVLEAFQAVADIAGLLRLAFRIDEDRQIAGDAGGIHVVEEIGAVAAEQILHIVLGGGEQHVDAGLVHQPVEAGVIERNGEALGWLAY